MSGAGGSSSSEQAAASTAARQWLQHFYNFVQVMHPAVEWVFPPIHRELVALSVTREWKGTSSTTGTITTVRAGDLLIGVRADGEWHGTAYSASPETTTGDHHHPQAVVSIPATPSRSSHGSGGASFLKRHQAYSGYGVGAKRGDENAFKPSRYMWMSKNLSFLLWDKGSDRVDSKFDEDEMASQSTDSDFGGGGGGGSDNMLAVGEALPHSAATSPTKSKKSYATVPKCIAVEDIISIVDSTTAPGGASGARDETEARLCFTVLFWLRGHSLGARPKGSRASSSSGSSSSSSDSLEVRMPTEEAKTSLMFLLTTLANHRQSAAVAAEKQLQEAVAAATDGGPTSKRLGTLAVDTTAAALTIDELATRSGLRDEARPTGMSDVAVNVLSRLKSDRDRVGGDGDDADAVVDLTADFDTSVEESPEKSTQPPTQQHSEGGSDDNESGPWTRAEPVLVRRKNAYESHFGQPEWMRFSPRQDPLALEFWTKSEGSGAEDATGVVSFPWTRSDGGGGGAAAAAAADEAEGSNAIQPTGFKLEMGDLESVGRCVGSPDMRACVRAADGRRCDSVFLHARAHV